VIDSTTHTICVSFNRAIELIHNVTVMKVNDVKMDINTVSTLAQHATTDYTWTVDVKTCDVLSKWYVVVCWDCICVC
jgi:hypothetical protein